MYKPCKLTSTILELIFLLYIGLELNEPGGGWEQRVFNRIGIQNIVDDITFWHKNLIHSLNDIRFIDIFSIHVVDYI